MDLPRWLLLVAAAACGALGQYLAAWGTSRSSFAAALAVFAVGGWLLTRLGRDAPVELSTSTPLVAVHAPRRGSSMALLAAATVLAVVAALHDDITYSSLQLSCYCGSLLALLAFAYRADRDAAPQAQGAALTRADLVLLTVLTAIALFFRLWRLDHVPALIWDDEILYLADALGMLKEPLSPFASGEWGAPFLHAYSIAAAVSLVADRIVAMRLASAIPGALTVPLLYLAMRELFDRRFAVFAALLLAVSTWPTILARQGYVWAINGFAEAIVLFWLARGLRRGRFLDFALAGFGLGLGFLYTYAAAMMPAVLVVFVVGLAVGAPRFIGARFEGLAFLAFCALVVVAPRLTQLAANPDMRGYQVGAIVHGNEETSAFEIFSLQYEQMAESFNRRADNNELFVPAPSEPLLDPVSAAALGLGFFWALFSLRQLGTGLLLLTFVFMLVPPAVGLSSTEWATAWRACGVLPALFGLAAAPFAIAINAARTRGGRAMVGALLAPLLLLILGINAHGYFVRHANKPRWFYGRNAVHSAAVERILAAPRGTRIMLNHDLAFGQTRALTEGRRKFEVFTWPDGGPLPDLLGRSAHRTLVLAAAQRYWEDDIGSGALLNELLQHYYPQGHAEVVAGADGRPLLSTFEVEAADIQAAHGIASGATGTLVVRQPGAYSFDAGSAAITVDGKPATSRYLADGVYNLGVDTADHPTVKLRWSRDGGDLEEVPIAQLLRRGLPPWGLVESIWRDGRLQWQRWVPAAWYVADYVFELDPLARVEWSGRFRLPSSGPYTLMLMTQTEMSVEIDGTAEISHQRPGLEWLRQPLELSEGWHDLKVIAEPPVERRDLRLYWIDPRGRPLLIGGADTAPPVETLSTVRRRRGSVAAQR